MSKLVLWFGGLLMVAAFGALVFFTMLPEDLKSNPTVETINNTLFCDPGERYVESIGALVFGSGTRPLGREYDIYCENSEGQQRDVTERSILIIAGSFVGLFVSGLILVLIGIIAVSARISRRVITTSAGPTTVFSTSPGRGVQYSSTVVHLNDKEIPPEAADMIRQMFDSMQTASTQMQPSSGGDLVSKLRQLEEARDANLISQTEYDRLRQQILDRADD